ncbi:MAG TPA: tetratricopeptide repeat protein, partial [Nitrospiria bacterium]|nr:tetratricopeptide repeat protein [Nitrospiria bacterium]
MSVALAAALSGCAGPAPLREVRSPEPPGASRALDQCAERCFAEAKAALAAGDVATAQDRLRGVRRAAPNTRWAGRAALLLARVDAERDPEAGLRYALQAAADLPELGDHALAVAADAAQHGGRPVQAAGYLHELARRYPQSSLVPTALWSAAALWAPLDGRQGEAIAALTALSTDFPSDPRVPEALAKIVSLAAPSGRREEAALACRRLVVDFPASPDAASVAESCLKALRDDGAPLTFSELRRRAEGLARGAKFSEALDVWQDLKRSAP